MESLYLYSEIGEMGKSQEEFANELNQINPKSDLTIHISSPGGSVFEGWTIGNMISERRGKTVAKIEGLCGSIATYIALKCDEVHMSETGRFTIHNPSTMAVGEEKDLKAASVQLASIKDDLIKTYQKKTGLSPEDLSQMMDVETSMTTQEAVDKGFVDKTIESEKAVARVEHNNINKMSEEKKETKLEKLAQSTLNAMNELLESVGVKSTEEKNENVELEDGTTIFVDSEDGELEGKPAFTVDEEGNPTETPAPEGTHLLNDGRSITVDAEGIVTGVEETEEGEEDAEMENLKAQLAESQEENKTLQAENKKISDEMKAFQKETTNGLNKVKQEFENKLQAFKNETLGEEPDVKVAEVDLNKKKEVHPMDAFAASLRKTRN